MNPQKENAHIYRIDKFKVPAAAREEFLSRVRTSNEVLHTIPGFVEDRFFEQLGATGDSKIVTIARRHGPDGVSLRSYVRHFKYMVTGTVHCGGSPCSAQVFVTPSTVKPLDQ